MASAPSVPPGARCHQCGELIARLDQFLVAKWRSPRGEITAAVCSEVCRVLWGSEHWRVILGPELSDPISSLEEDAHAALGNTASLKAALLRDRASAEVVPTTA